MRWKKLIPESLVRFVMSLHEEAKVRVNVDSESSQVLDVEVGMHYIFVLRCSFAVVTVLEESSYHVSCCIVVIWF